MYRPNVAGCSFLVVKQINSFRCFTENSSKKLLEFLATMPKSNSARITEVQKQRQNIAKKAKKYTPSTVYLQLLGSGANGAPNTLYLFSDQKRYLFNCGESTQRLAHEHKVRLTRLDHIFITNKSWQNIGGLPGLSLTLQDVGVPNITLHGPEGLDELYFATRRFVIMKDMNVTMASCTPDQDFEDDVMTVKYVLLPRYDLLDNLKQPQKRQKVRHVDKEFEEFVHDNTDYYGRNNNKTKSKPAAGPVSKSGSKSPTHREATLSKTGKNLMELQKIDDYTVAYICTLKKRLGTLDLEKCVELGVPPGPMLGQLKSGFDVVLKGGTVVHSKDVKTPDDPGPVFIVLEVPDIEYLKEEQFAAHYNSPDNQQDNIPTLIVHFTPPHVMQLERYQNFMKNFGPTTRHLIVNSQNTCLGSEAVHRTQHRLHLLDPDIFPLLKDISLKAVWDTNPPSALKTDSPEKSRCLEELKNKIAIAQFQNIISMEGRKESRDIDRFAGIDVVHGKTMMIHHLRPKREIDRSAEPKLHIQEYIKDTMDIDGFGTSLSKFQKIADDIREAKRGLNPEYPRVIFLGTGSCIPSKTRNTSAIALLIDENRSLLMDCGEGTYGQLVRFFGPKRVNAFLRSLKAVYISHLHADHHIGLIGVLQARRQAFLEVQSAENAYEPLYLLAPGQIYTWLDIYDQQFEKIKSDFTLIPNQGLLEDAQKTDMTPAILASMGVEAIVTCLVAHCPNAFGVAIQIGQDKKITYSGDTLPCDELVKIGENSTLLIHEATMEDELEAEARTKRHSTTSQAIEVGRKMNANFTVLTHFSQRYARLPRLNAQILNNNTSVGIAFDNMQITLNDLPLLPYMYAPLQMMFADHCVEMELRAAQRNTKKERREAIAKKKLRRSPLRSPLRSYSKSPTNPKTKEPVKGVGGAGRFQKVLVVAQNEVVRQPAKKSNVDGRATDRVRSTESRKSTSLPDEPQDSNVTLRKRCTSQEGKKLPASAFYKETNASRLRQQAKGMQVFGAIRSHSVSPNKKTAYNKIEDKKPEENKCASLMKKQICYTLSAPARKPPERPFSQSTKERRKTTKPRRDKSGTSIVSSDKIPPALSVKQPPAPHKEPMKSPTKIPTQPNITHLQTQKKDASDVELTKKESFSIPGTLNVTPPNNCEPTNVVGGTSVTNEVVVESFEQKMKEIQDKLQVKLNIKVKGQSEKVKPQNSKTQLKTFSPISEPHKLNSNHLLDNTANIPNNGKAADEPCSAADARSKIKSGCLEGPAGTKRSLPPSRASLNSNNSQVNVNREMPLKRKDSPVDPYLCPSSATITLSSSKTRRSNFTPARNLNGNTLSECHGAKKDTCWPRDKSVELINIKKYEPNLEGIRSTESFIKVKRNCGVKMRSSCVSEVVKPQPFKEENRRQLLDEVKRKFLSKSFREDFRFEKIEGLNWISWKK